MAYPDTEPDFEHDSEDQNTVVIGKSNGDPTFDNVHNSSISDCTDIKQNNRH